MAVTAGENVITLELSQEKAVLEQRIHLEQELFENITGHNGVLDESALSQQMHALGWDYTTKQMIVIVHLGWFDGSSDWQKLEQQLSCRLADWLKRQAFLGIFCHKGEEFVCLCGLPQNADDQQLLEALTENFTELLTEWERDFHELLISIGLSRPTARLGGLGDAYSEAQKAVCMGRRVYGGGSVYDYRKMGVYRLLFTHSDTDSLREFYEDYLAPLVQYDQKHGSDLVHTIEAYYQNNGNTLATAERLYIHRNTLNYRLKRASETLGFNVDDVERKLCVSLALQIKTFLNL